MSIDISEMRNEAYEAASSCSDSLLAVHKKIATIADTRELTQEEKDSFFKIDAMITSLHRFQASLLKEDKKKSLKIVRA